MLSWLAENGGTIGVLVLLLLVVGGIIAGILRDRRKGKSSCGSNCSGCPMGGSCHPKKKRLHRPAGGTRLLLVFLLLRSRFSARQGASNRPGMLSALHLPTIRRRGNCKTARNMLK